MHAMIVEQAQRETRKRYAAEEAADTVAVITLIAQKLCPQVLDEKYLHARYEDITPDLVADSPLMEIALNASRQFQERELDPEMDIEQTILALKAVEEIRTSELAMHITVRHDKIFAIASQTHLYHRWLNAVDKMSKEQPLSIKEAALLANIAPESMKAQLYSKENTYLEPIYPEGKTPMVDAKQIKAWISEKRGGGLLVKPASSSLIPEHLNDTESNMDNVKELLQDTLGMKLHEKSVRPNKKVTGYVDPESGLTIAHEHDSCQNLWVQKKASAHPRCFKVTEYEATDDPRGSGRQANLAKFNELMEVDTIKCRVRTLGEAAAVVEYLRH